LLFGTFGVALVLLGIVIGLVAIYLRVFHGFGFRPVLTFVLLLETVGFSVFGFGLVAEMVAALREEVDSLRRGQTYRRTGGRRAGERLDSR
jgi:hypothetical protein